MHTCMYASIQTNMQAETHTCVHAWVQRRRQSDMLTYVHACIRAYMHSYVHSSMPACMHVLTYVPTYMHYIVSADGHSRPLSDLCTHVRVDTHLKLSLCRVVYGTPTLAGTCAPTHAHAHICSSCLWPAFATGFCARRLRRACIASARLPCGKVAGSLKG